MKRQPLEMLHVNKLKWKKSISCTETTSQPLITLHLMRRVPYTTAVDNIVKKDDISNSKRNILFTKYDLFPESESLQLDFDEDEHFPDVNDIIDQGDIHNTNNEFVQNEVSDSNLQVNEPLSNSDKENVVVDDEHEILQQDILPPKFMRDQISSEFSSSSPSIDYQESDHSSVSLPLSDSINDSADFSSTAKSIEKMVRRKVLSNDFVTSSKLNLVGQNKTLSKTQSTRNANRSFQSSSESVKVIYVPESRVGRIIGQGGSTINALRKLTSVHIDISKQTEMLDSRRRISLQGNPCSVVSASDYIQQLVSGRLTSKDVVDIAKTRVNFSQTNSRHNSGSSISSTKKPQNKASPSNSISVAHNQSGETFSNSIASISSTSPSSRPLPILELGSSPPATSVCKFQRNVALSEHSSNGTMNFAKIAAKGLFPIPSSLCSFSLSQRGTDINPTTSTAFPGQISHISTDFPQSHFMEGTSFSDTTQGSMQNEMVDFIPLSKFDLSSLNNATPEDYNSRQSPVRTFSKAPGSDRPVSQKRVDINVASQSAHLNSNVFNNFDDACKRISVYGLFPSIIDNCAAEVQQSLSSRAYLSSTVNDNLSACNLSEHPFFARSTLQSRPEMQLVFRSSQ